MNFCPGFLLTAKGDGRIDLKFYLFFFTTVWDESSGYFRDWTVRCGRRLAGGKKVQTWSVIHPVSNIMNSGRSGASLTTELRLVLR